MNEAELAELTKLERRLDAAQRAISALVHHIHPSRLDVVRAIDDAIEAYPAKTWKAA